MKVLSFLEVNQLGVDEQVEYANWVVNNFKWESRLVDFYAQPFKPELIQELFEGWRKYRKKDSIGHIESVYGKKGEHKIGFSISTMFTRKIDDYCDKHNISPRTLDRFICHSQDVGIELKWRIK